jgi:hypothetical protein
MARTRRPSYLSPIAYARRNGLYKGLLGGDRRWLVVGGTLWGMRALRKALGRTETVVTVEKMEPGQWMSLRTIAPPTRRERRAAKRAGKVARS